MDDLLKDSIPLDSEESVLPGNFYTTGFSELDTFISPRGGFPSGCITEVFGDKPGLDALRNHMPVLNLSLPNLHLPSATLTTLQDELEPIAQKLKSDKLVGIVPNGGSGASFSEAVLRLGRFVQSTDSALVIFLPHTKRDPNQSIAPQMLRFWASVRIRVLNGEAVVVKNRFGFTGYTCKL